MRQSTVRFPNGAGGGYLPEGEAAETGSREWCRSGSFVPPARRRDEFALPFLALFTLYRFKTPGLSACVPLGWWHRRRVSFLGPSGQSIVEKAAKLTLMEMRPYLDLD